MPARSPMLATTTARRNCKQRDSTSISHPACFIRRFSIMSPLSCSMFFFFQAEDGIRDLTVTGVQTCALPIFGKCLLAWLPKDDVETIVKQQGLKKRTPKTITSITKLLADLEHAKQSGYAVDDEENSLGARCLGAPIFDGMGNVTAALGASGTLTQMDEDGMPRIIDALKETARRISRQLQRSGSAGAA